MRLLESQEGVAVAGRAASAKQELDLIEDEPVDTVLLDFDLGSERALDSLTAVRARGFAGRVLIVTAGVSEQESVHLVQAGVAAIFHKHKPPEQIRACVRTSASGEVWLERSYLKSLFKSLDAAEPACAPPKLTDREREALRAVFQCLSNKKIAERLGRGNDGQGHHATVVQQNRRPHPQPTRPGRTGAVLRPDVNPQHCADTFSPRTFRLARISFSLPLRTI